MLLRGLPAERLILLAEHIRELHQALKFLVQRVDALLEVDVNFGDGLQSVVVDPEVVNHQVGLVVVVVFAEVV